MREWKRGLLGRAARRRPGVVQAAAGRGGGSVGSEQFAAKALLRLVVVPAKLSYARLSR